MVVMLIASMTYSHTNMPNQNEDFTGYICSKILHFPPIYKSKYFSTTIIKYFLFLYARIFNFLTNETDV